ncbi:MAG: hypothetical protein GX567_02750, partial [Clostridia bacterium]|nr:hypothetical protein [Clostridia bacterium]
MAVNGIGQYDLFKQYSQNIDHNRIQINNHEKISALEPSIKDVKSNDVRQHEAEETLSPAQNRRLDSRTRASELEDISLNFNKNEEKSLLGKDSNLADLDVEKAISDMR